MTTFHAAGAMAGTAKPLANASKDQDSSGTRESSENRGELTGMYVGLAAVGVASLGFAAASSLAAGAVRADGPAAWWGWTAAILASVWAVAAGIYSVAVFRSGRLPQIVPALRLLVVAAVVHLATLVVGVWGVAEGSRHLDITVGSLLVLELSLLAVIGWRRNRTFRVSRESNNGRNRPAFVVLGVMFVASIVVASVTTVGLAASTAGEFAVPHGEHGTAGEHGTSNLERLNNSGHHH
ncbi:hypothetical protein ACQR35_06370 [Pseudarthrobacter sp. J1738]|uniref:hypothetical protein n=1 Tax=Pseudarthrobacter sp. J1738 TaxID=3420446 RepID=UPI003D2DF92B